MFAGVAMYELKPGKKLAATNIWRESFLPAVSKQRDFKSALWLVAREEDKAIGIELWEDDVGVSAFEASGLFHQLTDKFAGVLAQPPVRVEYQATLSDDPTSAGATPGHGQGAAPSSSPKPGGTEFKILGT